MPARAERRAEVGADRGCDLCHRPDPAQQPRRERAHQRRHYPNRVGKNPHELAQKDTDARRTKKNGQSIYGFKDHANADRDTKLIAARADTQAAAHDSQMPETVLRVPADGGAEVHVDSTYRSE